MWQSKVGMGRAGKKERSKLKSGMRMLNVNEEIV
jgi:hypothetical protein